MLVPEKPRVRCSICGLQYEFRADQKSRVPALYWMPIGHDDCAREREEKFVREEIARQRQVSLDAFFRAANVPEDLVRSKTFDAFEVGPGNRRAFDVMRSWEDGDKFGVMLQGTPGTGKTHLMLAFANERIMSGKSIFFKRVVDFFDDLRRGYKDGSYQAQLDRMRAHPLIVIDDLGAEKTTEWVEEKLFQVLDDRMNNSKPTFFTTNWTGKDLAQRINPRVVSRIVEMATCITITGNDFRTNKYRDREALLDERVAKNG